MSPDGVIVYRVYECNSAAEVKDPKAGVWVEVRSEDGLLWDPNIWDSAMRISLGTTGDRHSGDEYCVMRIANADAYKGPGNVRYWLGGEHEQLGVDICYSRKGTGVNRESHSPQSRYGDATYGNCVDQIRVKDSGP